MNTAVEWLFNQLSINNITLDKGTKAHQEMEQKILKQAKEMEKEQKIAFAKKCIHKALESDILMAYNQVEQYYNETFKQQEQ